MLKKFPFGDSLLKDLGILQPDRVHSYAVDTVVKLAKCFPQLGLDNSQSIDCLREEFMDFLLFLLQLCMLLQMDLINQGQVNFGWKSVN